MSKISKSYKTLGQCTALAGGNTYSGILLQYMIHAYEAGTFDGVGGPWHAKTKGEIMEALGFKRDRYDRALSRLMDNELIQIKHGPHPFFPNKLHCTWFKVPPETLEKLAQLPSKTAFYKAGKTPLHKAGTAALLKAGQPALPYIEHNTEQDILEYTEAPKSAFDQWTGKKLKASLGDLASAELTQSLSNSFQEASMIAKSITQTVQEYMAEMKKGITVPDKIETAAHFYKLWGSHMATEFPNYKHLPPGPKLLGMTKSVWKKLLFDYDQETMHEAVKHIISQWATFRVYYSTIVLKEAPTRPDIPFLSGNMGLILEWLHLPSFSLTGTVKTLKTLD